MFAPHMPRRTGVTLTELLVVIAIILLLSAAALPTAYVTFAERAVSEGASIVQANLSMTRDRAAGTGQPQGVRFLPDPDLTDLTTGIVVSNRMVTLTTPPNYSEGLVIPVIEIFEYPGIPATVQRLAVYGAKHEHINGIRLPASPTSWYFNIRQGERLRIGNSGNEFVIAGPITIGPNFGNPERFINQTQNLRRSGTPVLALPNNPFFEVLHLVNGRDDDRDGYSDSHFDGIDNNGDSRIHSVSGITLYLDPGYNGIDDELNDPRIDPPSSQVDDPRELLISNFGSLSYLPSFSEHESDEPILNVFEFVRYNGDVVPSGPFAGFPLVYHREDVGRSNPLAISDPSIKTFNYTISRRLSTASDSREYTLPSGAVIDFTTANLGRFSERSRVPIDPVTGYVDLVIFPDGRVVPSTSYGLRGALDPNYPFYFLWIAAPEDIHPPNPTNAQNLTWPALPLPIDPVLPTTPVLEGYRRMVTISPNSAHASASEITEFGRESQATTPELRNLFRELPYEEARRFQQTGR